MILLFISLRKKIGSFGMKDMAISFVKIVSVSLVMGLIAKLSFNALTSNIGQNFALLVSIAIGAVVYGVLIYFRRKEIKFMNILVTGGMG